MMILCGVLLPGRGRDDPAVERAQDILGLLPVLRTQKNHDTLRVESDVAVGLHLFVLTNLVFDPLTRLNRRLLRPVGILDLSSPRFLFEIEVSAAS